VIAAVESDQLLARREATLRSAATVCLAGIALVQAIALPPVFSEGARFAALTTAAMALCVALGIALAAAPADAGPRLWRTVAAAAVLVLAGWAAPHAFAIPGLTGAEGDWTAMPGGLSAGFAAGCLALAVAAARPSKAALRSLFTAGIVLVALAPPTGALLVAVGPGPAGGEAVLDRAAHVHSHADPEAQVEYLTGPGGGRLVWRTAPAARQTSLGALTAAAAALLFACGAIDRLRRRSARAPATAAGALGSGAA
jgi:hypothetical protein